jgi:hypothetical protein
MTRILTLGAVGAFVASLALLIGGLASQSAGLMMLPILCTFPLFMLLLGASLGRASNEFQVVRRSRSPQPANRRLERIQAEREPLS